MMLLILASSFMDSGIQIVLPSVQAFPAGSMMILSTFSPKPLTSPDITVASFLNRPAFALLMYAGVGVVMVLG